MKFSLILWNHKNLLKSRIRSRTYKSFFPHKYIKKYIRMLSFESSIVLFCILKKKKIIFRTFFGKSKSLNESIQTKYQN